MADPDGMRCELITDESGEVIASARVSADLGEEGRAALLNVIAAARRLHEQQLAEDPERAKRQAAALERIRERGRRWRDDDRG